VAGRTAAQSLAGAGAVRHAFLPIQFGLLVVIDGLTPGLPAQIDARRAANGDVQVTTRNVEGFTIAGQGSEPAQVTVDGAAVRVKRGAALSFNKSPNKSPSEWRQGLVPATAKRPGAEGPIARAASERHIYVYGTLGAQTAEELEDRRRQAQAAANWSTIRSHLLLSLPVKADREVTADDIDSADLVLFGTAESNALVARFAGKLPLNCGRTRRITDCFSSLRWGSIICW